MAQNTPIPNRTYKATIFEMIFSRKEECLNLYNAVNGTHYTDSEKLEINTLQNAIYMAVHNDISFVIDSRMSLYEHQSTKNPNLPLRFLIYVANLYSGIVKNENIYSETLIKIPTPHFLIFYNGTDIMPEREELSLSEAYIKEEECPALELKATMININPGFNDDLKASCRTLAEYTEFTARVRTNVKTMSLAEAVDFAIDSCIRDDILAEFLEKNRDEVRSMSIFEYDEQEHMRMEREEHWQKGYNVGVEQGMEQKLIHQIENKLAKGQSVEQIADALEETSERVKELMARIPTKTLSL